MSSQAIGHLKVRNSPLGEHGDALSLMYSRLSPALGALDGRSTGGPSDNFSCCTGMSPSASQPGCQDLPTRAARVVLGRKGAGVRRVLLEMASGAIKEFEFVRSVTIANGKGNIRLAFEAAICRFFSSASVNVRTDACRSVALLSAGRCYRSPGGLCSLKLVL
jgi:hypothetical protein